MGPSRTEGLFCSSRIGRAEWRDSATAAPHGVGSIRRAVAHLAKQRWALTAPLRRGRRLEQREPLLEVRGRRAATCLQHHQTRGSQGKLECFHRAALSDFYCDWFFAPRYGRGELYAPGSLIPLASGPTLRAHSVRSDATNSVCALQIGIWKSYVSAI